MTTRVTVAVVGQGYVGLPLAVAAGEAGYDVTGIDTNAARVDLLNDGESPVGDVPSERLKSAIASGRYRAAADYSAATADVVVLCVPTPYKNEAPDLSYIESAARGVAPHIRQGTLVILESTTYPGTTEEFLQPILEEGSGLEAGSDFNLAFSPERIDPGNPQYDIHNTPKIVGGVSAEGTTKAAEFYGSFVERVVEVSSPMAAETAKLLENTFRHINIALVNELAILCRDLGVDVWEVIDAAASKPFGFMPFYPGPGVGGHCIPVDPMYLSWRVRQFGGSAKFIELARDVNAAMPLYCISRIQELLNDKERSLKGARVLIVGVAYKKDIGDMRESPALPLIERLVQRGALVDYHDPHVPELQVEGAVLASVPLDSGTIASADCVVVVTPHSDVDLTQLAEEASLVFDTRNAVPRREGVVFRL